MHSNRHALLAAASMSLACACSRADAPPTTTPVGGEESARTNVLEAGSTLLQGEGPLAGHDVHLVGFHPLKEDPEHQMLAHHYCRQVNEDFAQCVLYDGAGAGANLTGIEYIVSERLHAVLPAGERDLWHPHNGEILSGQLIAPGLPQVAEQALMRDKMNSYGKTWHTWPTHPGDRPQDRLPLGPPMLAWSFSRDGELRPELLEARDKALDVSTATVRRDRQSLLEHARPQHGVDALEGKFPRNTKPIPGVSEAPSPPGNQ